MLNDSIFKKFRNQIVIQLWVRNRSLTRPTWSLNHMQTFFKFNFKKSVRKFLTKSWPFSFGEGNYEWS